MKSIIFQIAHNHVLIVTLLAWVIAQSIKVALGVLRTKRFDFRWFIGTGGMPSAHAAGSGALAVVLGIDYGFSSPLFALGAAFAMVTMFDAQGVRRSTGKQASLLNKILDDIYWKGKMQEDRLKELIGHTPIEVIMGAIIGILLALIF
ncbi:MAG: divergent PAP2 family protein [Candidatus Omnitrophica bacterium]|nr:divergent PAP2 family protein [Candidatus Omnitrophota bacterium]MDD5574431.1 divergent PAP2 family protein [Candidatus Omnitrophota bacterium]